MYYVVSQKEKCLNSQPITASFIKEDSSLKNINLSNRVKYHPDQLIILEGDKIECLYEIISGTVRLYKILNDGRRFITNFCTKGDIIGLPTGGNYFHSVEAVSKTTVRYYNMGQIKKMMETEPGFAQDIVHMAHNRLNDACEQMITLARKNPEERVATFLLNYPKWSSVSNPENFIINIPMSRLDIADHLGLTQETVCRVLSKFKREGLIELLRSDQLILKKRKELSECAKLSDEDLNTSPRSFKKAYNMCGDRYPADTGPAKMPQGQSHLQPS